MPMSDHRSHRWFQLSLKSLFLLTLLVATFFAGYVVAIGRAARTATASLPDPNNIRHGERLSLACNSVNVSEPTRWTVRVWACGGIRLPELGQVPAAGLSLDDLTKDLNERYSAHYSSLYSAKLKVEVFVSFENTAV